MVDCRVLIGLDDVVVVVVGRVCSPGCGGGIVEAMLDPLLETFAR